MKHSLFIAAMLIAIMLSVMLLATGVDAAPKELSGDMEEIVQDIQRQFLPYVFDVGRALGIQMQVGTFRKGAWEPDPKRPGQWNGKGIRVFIRFPENLTVIKQTRKIGSIRPVGKPTQSKTIAGEIDATSSEIDLTEEITYSKGTSYSEGHVKSKVFGYSFTAKFETKFGGENASVQSTVGFEASTSGEFSDEVATTKESSDTVEFKTSFTVPAGKKALLLQDVTQTDIEVDIVDHVIVDMPFEIWTYKTGAKGSYVAGNPDVVSEKYGGKWVRRQFTSKGVNDLSLSLRGKNRRYPNIPKNSFNTWQHAPAKMGGKVDMRKIYKYFTDETKRTFIIKGTLKRTDAEYGKVTLTTE